MPILKIALANCKEHDADELQQLYSQFYRLSNFVPSLLKHLDYAQSQVAVTWLLKRHLESGYSLLAQQQTRLISGGCLLQPWQAKLHLLQMLDYLNIDGNNALKLESFVRGCLQDDNKFVRAWAYNGFYLIAIAEPRYQQECADIFSMAMRDEAASVKARIRNILKHKEAQSFISIPNQ